MKGFSPDQRVLDRMPAAAEDSKLQVCAAGYCQEEMNRWGHPHAENLWYLGLNGDRSNLLDYSYKAVEGRDWDWWRAAGKLGWDSER